MRVCAHRLMFSCQCLCAVQTSMSPVTRWLTLITVGLVHAAGQPPSEVVRDLAVQSGLKRLINEARPIDPHLAKIAEAAGAYLATAENGVLWRGKRKGKTSGHRWAECLLR